MSNHIGKILKIVAVIVFFAGIIASVVIAVPMFDHHATESMGAGVLLGGIVLSFISACVLFALGEITESAQKCATVAEQYAAKSVPQQPTPQQPQAPKPEVGAVCELCGKRVSKLQPVGVPNETGVKTRKLCQPCATKTYAAMIHQPTRGEGGTAQEQIPSGSSVCCANCGTVYQRGADACPKCGRRPQQDWFPGKCGNCRKSKIAVSPARIMEGNIARTENLCMDCVRELNAIQEM